jgi:GNAT superfamily N-acetyltransferase
MSVTVRRAVASDVAVIHGFICALAEYERLAHEVEISVADVERDLFGPTPRLYCDIAEADGKLIGFAIWFYNYSTFQGRHGIYLEDLFVVPQARGLGGGKALLRSLAQRCVAENMGRLEWAVLDWNAPSIAFYDSLGATAKTEWITRRLAGDALCSLAKS